MIARSLVPVCLLLASAGGTHALPTQPPPGAGAVSSQAAPPAPKEPLAQGMPAPEVMVRSATNEPMPLSSLWKDRPVVLVFYRGGWCPYCTGHLTQWQGKLAELEAAGATLVAISPEKPERASKTAGKHDLGFRIVSDASMDAARMFGLRFELDPDTQQKYRGYGVALDTINASGTWELPVPATFVIDRDGVIRYASADADYSKRDDPAHAIDAVRALTAAR